MKEKNITPHTIKILKILKDAKHPVTVFFVAERLYPQESSHYKGHRPDHTGVSFYTRQRQRMVGGQLGKLQKQGLVRQEFGKFLPLKETGHSFTLRRNFQADTLYWFLTDKGREVIKEHTRDKNV